MGMSLKGSYLKAWSTASSTIGRWCKHSEVGLSLEEVDHWGPALKAIYMVCSPLLSHAISAP
jgi:hypothetical protein